MKTTLKVLIILAVGLSIGYFGARAVTNFGSTGQTHYQRESFTQGLYGGTQRQFGVSQNGGETNGGATITTATSAVLSASTLCDLGLLKFALNANATITLPTASALNSNCLLADGASRSFRVFNQGTSTIGIATSTGDTISKGGSASSTLTLSSSTFPWGTITVTRVSSTADNYSFSQFQAGL